MLLSNADKEQLWIDGWEDLYQALAGQPAPILDEDGLEIALEEAQVRRCRPR